jgi:aminoglycoside phosphotransferase (APT) family kinase protein
LESETVTLDCLERSLSTAFESTCRSLLEELGLLQIGESFTAQSLTGGVASDIALIRIGDRKLCVKFALPKLKVAADWFAPVHRNKAEYAWLELVAKVAPKSAVKLLGQSTALHGFAMEFLDGQQAYLWKDALLAEANDNGEAALLGKLVGQVHAASTKSEFDTQAFQNADDFWALRIEPYLLYTASVHREVAVELEAMAEQLHQSNRVLVHGDVSPKNIFIRSAGPVVLDAECATMGDASFDLSFCMNHLILKAMHLPASQEQYLQNALQLWVAYKPFVSWESVEALESRICQLVPALMLARVDGKSPVEYLTESERLFVRATALALLKKPEQTLHSLLMRIKTSSQGLSS